MPGTATASGCPKPRTGAGMPHRPARTSSGCIDGLTAQSGGNHPEWPRCRDAMSEENAEPEAQTDASTVIALMAVPVLAVFVIAVLVVAVV